MADALPRLPADVFNDVASTAASRQETVTADGSPVPLVYGRQPLGASIIAATVDNTDLILACGWCLGEIDAIESLTINGLAPAESVTVTHYLGTTSQTADATLAAAIPGYSDTLVVALGGEVHGIAYSVLRIPSGAVSGFPRVEAILRGRKVYDPRTSAIAYSANPALALRDFAASSAFGPGLDVDEAAHSAAATACDEVLTTGVARRSLGLVIGRH